MGGDWGEQVETVRLVSYTKESKVYPKVKEEVSGICRPEEKHVWVCLLRNITLDTTWGKNGKVTKLEVWKPI